MKQGTLPEIVPRRRRLALNSWVSNKRNVVVVVGTILLHWGVGLRHVMEIQEIVILWESIKLVSWVLIAFYELLIYEERFWPFSRIWEIWSMEDWSILRVVVPSEEIWPLDRIMIFHGVDFGQNEYKFCLDMCDTPRVCGMKLETVSCLDQMWSRSQKRMLSWFEIDWR